MADTEAKAKPGKPDKSDKAPRPDKGDKGQAPQKGAKPQKDDKAAKREGGEVTRTKPEEASTGEVVDLLAALQRSVEAAKTSRGEDTSSSSSEDEKPAKKASPLYDAATVRQIARDVERWAKEDLARS